MKRINCTAGRQAPASPIVNKLQSILGEKVLLLSWPYGTKGDKRRWKHLTVEEMNKPSYLQRLANGNIGIAQGGVSNGLCSIDIDIDTEVDEFLHLNPKKEEFSREDAKSRRGRGYLNRDRETRLRSSEWNGNKVKIGSF
jgi:hypothetical protein